MNPKMQQERRQLRMGKNIWRIGRLMVVSFMVTALLCGSGASAEGSLEAGINNALFLDSDSRNSILVGQYASILIEENETTPYRWELVISDETVMELVNDVYIQDPNPHDYDGVGGKHHYNFLAIGVGECSVDLYLIYIGDNIDAAEQKISFICSVEEYAMENDNPSERIDPLNQAIFLSVEDANELKVGEICAFCESEKQSIPYRWRYLISDEELIIVSGDTVKDTSGFNVAPGGDSAYRIIEFTASAPGECMVTFRYGSDIYEEWCDDFIEEQICHILIKE